VATRRPAGSDSTERIRLLFRDIFFRARTISRRRLGHLGLTPTQFMMLGALMRNDGCSVGELADETGIAASTASRILARLEGLGYLERNVGSQDRRRITVTLRPRGKRIQKRVRRFWTGMGREMFGDFSAAERRSLERALARVHENLMRLEEEEST
jgi:DNA-binding MarR family transcriptional regulator